MKKIEIKITNCEKYEKMNKITAKGNNFWEYIWEDEYGSHTYIFKNESGVADPGEVKNFTCSSTKMSGVPNYRVYRWSDDFGDHYFKDKK